jgi:cytosine/adenosine deaminase-related metal-dependent hydrolase
VINDIIEVMRIGFVMHSQAVGIPLFDPYAFTTEDAFAMGTIDAARLLNWADEIGSLEAGKAADVVVLNGDNVRLTPSYDPIGTIVRYARGTDVESVLIGGDLVVNEGNVLTIDQQELLKEAEIVGAKLGRVLGPRRYRQIRQAN